MTTRMPEGNLKGQCFICRGVAKSSSFPGRREWAAFDFLCDLLDMSWARRLTVLKPRNSDFCESCELHIKDAMTTQNEIKALELKLLERKCYLMKTVTRCYQWNPDADTQSGRSSSLTLGRMLSQCWSECTVTLDRPNRQANKRNAVDEIPVTTADLPVHNEATSSSGESDGDLQENEVMSVDSEYCPSSDGTRVEEMESDLESDSVEVVDETKPMQSSNPRGGPDCIQDRQPENQDIPEYRCEVCGKLFNVNFYLRAHRYQAHEKPPDRYSCEICEAEFTDEAKFKSHLDRHGSGPGYACNACDEELIFFRTASEARQHYSEKHPDSTTALIFTCYSCRRSFGAPGELFSHQRASHTLEWRKTLFAKVYPCHECGLYYSYAHNLAKHWKHHHLGVPREN